MFAPRAVGRNLPDKTLTQKFHLKVFAAVWTWNWTDPTRPLPSPAAGFTFGAQGSCLKFLPSSLPFHRPQLPTASWGNFRKWTLTLYGFFYFFPFLPPSPSAAAAATAHHKHSRNFNDPSHWALGWIRACFWTLLDTPLALASCQGTLRDLCDNLKFPLKSVCQQFELQTIIQAENIPFSFHIFV